MTELSVCLAFAQSKLFLTGCSYSRSLSHCRAHMSVQKLFYFDFLDYAVPLLQIFRYFSHFRIMFKILNLVQKALYDLTPSLLQPPYATLQLLLSPNSCYIQKLGVLPFFIFMRSIQEGMVVRFLHTYTLSRPTSVFDAVLTEMFKHIFPLLIFIIHSGHEIMNFMTLESKALFFISCTERKIKNKAKQELLRKQ